MAEKPDTTTRVRHLRDGDYFGDYWLLLAFYIVHKLRYRWTARSAVELIIENEGFSVMCVHDVKTINVGISCCRLADCV